MPSFHPLNTRLITPEKVLFEGEVRSVVAPAVNGMLGVLGGHAPLMVALGSGVLKLTTGSERSYYAVSGGFLQVKDNSVIVLADKAVDAADVDLAEARNLQSRLEKALDAEADTVNRKRLKAELVEARAVVDAAEKYRDK
ncbi:MAG: ATP synthase F1 subunit epsilon [Candidatus Glassbacteria bacterium]|nr:ATP synthase F1 subunit epsilon [Candidatus Glassbacteria bacterium]